MNRLRCGIIGFDFGHQGAFAGSFAKMDEVQIVGAADLPDAPDEARARGWEFAHGCGVEYFEDYTDLLAAQELDLVSLCITPERNPDLVEEMCARGVHVMSEKPISADTAGAERIAKAVRFASLFMISFPNG